jgi:hypothetical protein
MPFKCKGKLMSAISRRLVTSSLFSAVIILTGLASGNVFATDLIILRDVPSHSAVEPIPPGGGVVSVQVEESDLIVGLLSGPKPLNDDDFGAVVASPPGGQTGGIPTENDTRNVIDGSRGDALSNVPGNGMGSFSSLGGIGAEISGQVNSAVTNGLQGLSSSLGAATGAQQ